MIRFQADLGLSPPFHLPSAMGPDVCPVQAGCDPSTLDSITLSLELQPNALRPIIELRRAPSTRPPAISWAKRPDLQSDSIPWWWTGCSEALQASDRCLRSRSRLCPVHGVRGMSAMWTNPTQSRVF